MSFPLLEIMPLIWLAVLILLLLSAMAEGKPRLAPITAAFLSLGFATAGLSPWIQAINFVLIWLLYRLFARLLRIAFRD